MIAFASAIDPWFRRVAAIGHGKFTHMSMYQANIVVADMERSLRHQRRFMEA